MDEINDTVGQTTPGQPRKKFWKFWLLMILINIGFVVVIVRLFSIQVLDTGFYKEKARRQHETEIDLKPKRGEITDRNGKVLATDVNSLSVAIDPEIFNSNDSHEKLAEKLSKVLSKHTGKSKDSFHDRISNAKGSFAWLARGLNYGAFNELSELDRRGVIIVTEPRRLYPWGEVGAQVIGCTNIDNEGINGAEKYWDNLLRGKAGYMLMNRDAKGILRPSAELPVVPPTNGKSIKLTIDIQMQEIAEYELKKGVLDFGAESGMVVAVDPKTGEVLAMASYPGYDPNNFAEENSGTMRNRALTDVYEPGSTFKLITAAAALEKNAVSTGEVFDAYNGVMQLDDYSIRDDHPLGKITFAEAMLNSSNIVFAQVANRLDGKYFLQSMQNFGFGKQLKIELPGEVTGKIPKVERMNSTGKRYAGFGYGISVTALQMIYAYAAIANGGSLMRPLIIKSVKDEDGVEYPGQKPEAINRAASPATVKLLDTLLCDVVDKGTGKLARINGLRMAGKTGTSQQLIGGAYSKSDYVASFAGFFPVGNPRVAMIVIIEKPRVNYYGGATAAPVFRNIALRWINSMPGYFLYNE